jgi:hypothetical protein
MPATEVLFREIGPLLAAGFVAAFLLSRWSPLPLNFRSRSALVLSAGLAIMLCSVPRFDIIYDDVFFGAVAAFGLVFAMSRIRTVGNPPSAIGWLCAVIHFLQVLSAWRSLLPPMRGR